jgi:hypothetical protein
VSEFEPEAFVTVSCTAYVPPSVYVCDGWAPDAVPPSPNVQLKLDAFVEAEPSQVNCNPLDEQEKKAIGLGTGVGVGVGFGVGFGVGLVVGFGVGGGVGVGLAVGLGVGLAVGLGVVDAGFVVGATVTTGSGGASVATRTDAAGV